MTFIVPNNRQEGQLSRINTEENTDTQNQGKGSGVKRRGPTGEMFGKENKNLPGLETTRREGVKKLKKWEDQKLCHHSHSVGVGAKCSRDETLSGDKTQGLTISVSG